MANGRIRSQIQQALEAPKQAIGVALLALGVALLALLVAFTGGPKVSA